MSAGVRRRAVLGAGAAACLAPLAGCASRPPGLEVVCAWGGTEYTAFRESLAGFTRTTGHPVRIVVANGNGVDAMLSARLAAGNRPDAAVFSEPSLITRYAADHHLVALDNRLGDHLPAYWRELASVDGDLYGCWLKVAHKSLFWYPRGELARRDEPADWAALVDLVRDWPGRDAPLAIGAADGWVLTDWFENVLASLDPGTYEAMAVPGADWDVEPVRDTLNLLARLWTIPRALPYGGARALLTPFDASVAQVFGERRAGMLFEGDFVAPVVAGLHTDVVPEVFRFPSLGARRPQIVGGDVAVLLRDSPAGRALMAYLSDPAAADPWIRAGFLAVPDTRGHRVSYPDRRLATLAAEIATAPERVSFDLSDRLTGALTGDDGKGSWLILSDFFRAVTGGTSRRQAIRDAVQAFTADAKATP